MTLRTRLAHVRRIIIIRNRPILDKLLHYDRGSVWLSWDLCLLDCFSFVTIRSRSRFDLIANSFQPLLPTCTRAPRMTVIIILVFPYVDHVCSSFTSFAHVFSPFRSIELYAFFGVQREIRFSNLLHYSFTQISNHPLSLYLLYSTNYKIVIIKFNNRPQITSSIIYVFILPLQ